MPTASRSIVSSPRAGRPPGRDPRGLRSERGAILVHVAAAFVGLLGFGALTIDLGILWVARTQAQSAADAAALVASVTFAYSDSEDAGVAEQAARAIAATHEVWGQPVSSAGDLGFSVIECPPGPPEVAGTCIQAQVFRGAGGGTSLTTLLAPILGAVNQQVRATAAAKVIVGNSTNCLRPWAVADSWNETQVPANEFNPARRSPICLQTTPAPGSGYTRAGWFGTELSLTPGNLDVPVVANDLFFTVTIPRADGETGEAGYALNVTSCNDQATTIGDAVETLQVSPGTTPGAVDALIALDPGANWDAGTGTVTGSAFVVSPRIVPDRALRPVRVGGAGQSPYHDVQSARAEHRRVFRRQLEGRARSSAYIVPMPGNLVTDAGAQHVSDEASFLRNVVLVR